MPFLNTALMLNADNSTYHLQAFPEDIAPLVILVGDPGRANDIAARFDHVEIERSHRGFILKTGQLKNKRLTVICTHIGCGNIDIVMNELDALVNIDFKTRQAKSTLTSLTIIRLGTAGAMQPNIPLGQLMLSTAAFAWDGLLNYYEHHYDPDEQRLFDTIKNHFRHDATHQGLYVGRSAPTLNHWFSDITVPGITLTSTGFYGPQYRTLRCPLPPQDGLSKVQHFSFQTEKITTLEMETAAIYALGKQLGHACCSISTAVVNRITLEKLTNAQAAIDNMVDTVLARLCFGS